MALSLIILLISFILSLALSVPFINLLYKLKFRTADVRSVDFLGKKTIFNKLHGHKVGTPTGGGILMILVLLLVTICYSVFTKTKFTWSFSALAITAGLFGVLGFLDDLKKIAGNSKPAKGNSFFGLRFRHKLVIQLILATFIFWILFVKVGVVHTLAVPLVGLVPLGRWGLPYTVLVITFFTNAFNITDGLDGLAGGLLLICLLPLWYLASISGNGEVVLFIVVTIGTLVSFLYFNINPARFFMGDTGALALGALLAVMSLMINTSFPLFVMGGVFVVEAFSSLIQWGSMLLRNGKRVFRIAPLHHHFEALGWEETKVTMRFWLAGALCALVGLLVALL